MPARPGDPAKTTARAAGRAAASRPASASPRASAPRGWRQYWQIVPLAGVLWALDAVDKFRAGAQAAGLLHAPVINDLSGRLSGSVAVVVNQRTSTHPQAAAPATAWYIVLHVLVTGTVGVLLLRSGHRSFGLHHNALIVAAVLGLVVFWAYPVGPAWMLPGCHHTAAATVPIFHSLLETKAADQFASFPSLHVTWAPWVAVATQSLARRRRWRAAAWAYPMLATVDVLATANHYLLDAVTAPAVLALAYATAAELPALAPLLRLPVAARPPAGEPRAVAGNPLLLAAEGTPTQASPVIHASSGLTGSSRNRVARRGGDPVRSAAETPAGGPWSSMVVVLGPCCHARLRTKALSGLSTIFPSGRTAQPAAGLAASARSPPRTRGDGSRRPARYPRRPRPSPCLARHK